MYQKSQTYITQTGFQSLKDKLDQLNHKRAKLGHDLHSVQEPGKRVENGSFSTIWEQKIQIEETMQDITATLRKATLIKRPTRRSRVMLGSTVKLKSEDTVRNFTLVDSPEADPSQGLVSYHSPAGESLLGKRIGDQVEIGNGHKVTYTVLEIS